MVKDAYNDIGCNQSKVEGWDLDWLNWTLWGTPGLKNFNAVVHNCTYFSDFNESALEIASSMSPTK